MLKINCIKYHLIIFLIVFLQFGRLLFAYDIGEDNKAKASSFIAQSKQKLGFEENKGQMQDMDGRAVSNVLYKVEMPNLNIWVTTSGLTYHFFKLEDEGEEEREKDEGHEFEWHRVDMILKNSNIKAENVIAEGEITQGKINYYLAHCPNGIFDVKTFSKIIIKNIYEGIDWVLYTNNGATGSSLKQDFIIHPNADPNQIKMIYEGSGEITIKDNQIQFENEIGKITEGKLFCYQGSESNEVGSKYVAKKNHTSVGRLTSDDRQVKTFSYEIGIQLNNYDKTKDLIIDPQIGWYTFYPGNLPDGPMSIECDSNDDLLVTGYTSSNTFPLLNPGGTSYYSGTNGGSIDVFITKYSNAGVLLWSTYFGGTAGEKGLSLCLDAADNLFITGFTASNNMPTLNPGGGAYFQAANAGSFDIILLKFTSNGQLSWSTYLGGTDSDDGVSICADVNGNIFVGGYTRSLNIPTLNAGGTTYFQAAHGGSLHDNFLYKFNNSGLMLWGTYLGGSDNDRLYSLSTDAFGNLYSTGTTASTNYPTNNPGGGAFFQGARSGNDDAFISKFDNTGTMLWSTFYGGTGGETGYTIYCDLQNNIYVTGETTSNNIPTVNPGGGAYFQAAAAGAGDIFICKFNVAGTHTWGTFYGGSGSDFFTYETDNKNIALDTCNNLYIALQTTSTNIPTKNTACSTDYNQSNYLGGPRDIVILRFTNLNLTWATYFGGDGNDFRQALALDKSSNLFISGEARTINQTATYPLTNPGGGAYYNAAAVFEDVYVAKIIPSPVTLTQSQVNVIGCSGCNGSATISLSCGNPPYDYIWSNSSQSLNDTSSTNTISNLCAGTYTVTIKSSCSQTLTATFTIAPGTGGPPITTSQNPSICTGNSFTLPGGTIVITAGTYIDTLLSYNGCDSIITTNLSIVNFITSSQSPTICTGNNFTLPDGSIVNTAGAYVDTIPSVGGCDSIITTNLTITPASTFAQSAAICTGQNYTLPDGSIVTIAGTYIDTLLTINGCDSIITTTLTVSAALTGSQNPIICNGNSFTLPGGAIVVASGTYMDTITSTGGCDSIITTTLIVNPNAASNQNPTICSNESYTLPSGVEINVGGTYYDTLLASNGCDSIITITLTVNPTPIVTISPDITITEGDSTILTASGGGTYLWFPTNGLDNSTSNSVIAKPNQTTTYCVEVTSNDGCKDTICVKVIIETPCPNSENLNVPNAFSPNKDGVNDEFCLQGWDACVEEFSILIFNRWGEKVYESKDPSFCWDGKLRGTTFDAQVFVYQIKATYLNIDKPIIKKGNISLLR